MTFRVVRWQCWGRSLRILLLSFLLCCERSAGAQVTVPSSTTGLTLSPPIQVALAKRDYQLARALLEQAYRQERRPELLFQLARVSAAQQQRVEAADYYRRYRDSIAPDDAERALLAEAEAFLNTFKETVAELQVVGPADALLFIGSRLIGTLPLPGTIFLPAGDYTFSLELGKTRKKTPAPLHVTRDRLSVLELFESDDRTLLYVYRPDPRLLLITKEAPGAAWMEPVYRAVARIAAERRNILISQDRAEEFARQQPGLMRCLERRDCRPPLVRPDELTTVLTLTIRSSAGTPAFELAMTAFDVESCASLGPFTAQSPSAAALPRAAADLAQEALNDINRRSRGMVRLTSVPVGVEIRQQERLLDSTPYQRTVFAGPQRFNLSAKGYLAQDVEISVQPDQVTTLNVTLQRAPWSGAGGRPRWRLALGGVLALGGLVMGGFGVSALAVDKKCGVGLEDDGFCGFFDTYSIGVTLTSVGAAVATSGALLMAWPASQRER